MALIPARGGSKSIPRKNIRLLGGKPLIAYAIETALTSSLVDRVVVSTDDEEIADIALSYGAEVPFMRPEALARDDSPEWLTWQHAIQTLAAMDGGSTMEVLVCVSPTSPLRAVEDVDLCIRTLLDGDADIVITTKTADRSPYFNMVTLDNQGCVTLAAATPERIHRRQDTPQIYDMTTVAYAARTKFVLDATWVFEGRVKAVLVPSERAIDIDTELDFAFAEYLLSRPALDQQRSRPSVLGAFLGEPR